MATEQVEAGGSDTNGPAGPNDQEQLRTELEMLGLNPNQARLLLALLRLGPSKAPDLSELSGVPRTSIYPVLEELGMKGLAERVSGPGIAVWAAPGRDEILDRLHEAELERFKEHEENTERVRRVLARTFPDAPTVSLSHAYVIRGMAHVRRAYDRMLAETRDELAMLVRPPYSWVLGTAMGRPNAAILTTLQRGVQARVLYQAAEWSDPENDAFRNEAAAYHAAGAQARLVDELPVKMVVSDRKTALVALTLEGVAEDSYPLTLWIEHPGYAAVHADAFEKRWKLAEALPPEISSSNGNGNGTLARRRNGSRSRPRVAKVE